MTTESNSAEHPAILVVGANPSWQKVLTFSQVHYGEVNRAATLETFASGKGINFCRAARCQRQNTTLLLQFAGGDNGRLLENALQAEGLLHHTIHTANAPTRSCISCISENDQTTTELIEPSFPPTPEEAAEALRVLRETLPGMTALALCGTLPNQLSMDFYVECVRAAHRSHKPVLIDSWQGIAPVLREPGCFTLKINQEELSYLTGEPQIPAALLRLFGEYPSLEACAITAGAKTAYWSDGTTLMSYQLTPLEKVVNPIGSGDTASAIYWSERLSGTPGSEAFRRALSAASANCMSKLCGSFRIEDAQMIYQHITLQTHTLS